METLNIYDAIMLGMSTSITILVIANLCLTVKSHRNETKIQKKIPTYIRLQKKSKRSQIQAPKS